MIISAKADARDSEMLELARDLYRDLSRSLRRAIDLLQQDGAGDKELLKEHRDLVRDHQRSLQSLIDLEVSFAKRSKAAGGEVELDLDAARAEIRARLARWAADR